MADDKHFFWLYGIHRQKETNLPWVTLILHHCLFATGLKFPRPDLALLETSQLFFHFLFIF